MREWLEIRGAMSATWSATFRNLVGVSRGMSAGAMAGVERGWEFANFMPTVIPGVQ